MSRLITPRRRKLIPRIASTEQRVRHLEVNNKTAAASGAFAGYVADFRPSTGGAYSFFTPGIYDLPCIWTPVVGVGSVATLTILNTGTYLLIVENVGILGASNPPKMIIFARINGTTIIFNGHTVPFILTTGAPVNPDGGRGFGTIRFAASAGDAFTIGFSTLESVNIAGPNANGTLMRIA